MSLVKKAAIAFPSNAAHPAESRRWGGVPESPMKAERPYSRMRGNRRRPNESPRRPRNSPVDQRILFRSRGTA